MQFKIQISLAERCATLDGFSDDIRASHLGIDFLIRQADLELELIDSLMAKYQPE